MNEARPSLERPPLERSPSEAHATRSTLLTTAEGEPSLGDLVMGLTDDITTLVRKEVELAKTELQENIKEGAQAGTMVAVGGMVAYAGLILLLIGVAIALGDWWNNLWLGAGVVGIVVGLIGWAVLNGGLKQLKEVSLVPHKTIASLERDAQMAKEKLS
jgi:uncharacterized membrane protein YqjE